MYYWSLCLQKGDIIWFRGPPWIRGPKECSEGWLVNWFCQPTAWYVYNHCLTSVILNWFYKYQWQCIQQEIGPHLLFYQNYCTDELVINKLHLLHTVFLFCLILLRYFATIVTHLLPCLFFRGKQGFLRFWFIWKEGFRFRVFRIWTVVWCWWCCWVLLGRCLNSNKVPLMLKGLESNSNNKLFENVKMF